MRAIVVDPMADFSTADVANGWVDGLRANGVEVQQFNLGERVVYYRSATVIGADGETAKPPMDLDDARQAATLNLLAEIYRTDPDVVLIVHGAHLWPPLMAEVRCPTVWVMTESPYEDEAQILTVAAAAPTAVLVNDPTNQGVFSQVAPCWYVPHAYRPTLHHPAGPSIAPVDVSFVGSGYPERIATLEAVNWDGIDLALAGWWDLDEGSPLAGRVLSECVPNSETVEWYRGTKVGVNMYRELVAGDKASTAAGWAMGPREVEMAACGLFFLRAPRPESDDVLGFLPSFSDPRELEELIRWWLPRDAQRAELAERARAAVADRTFDSHAARLLARLAQ